MANNKKVYVNPNFNRALQTNVQETPAYAHNKIIMHVNPNFSQQYLSNKTKIYINPNFLNTKNSNPNKTLVTLDSVNKKEILTGIPNIPLIDPKTEKVPPQQATSRTRYTLVRQNTSKNTYNDNAGRVTTTIKINKYKSVNFNNFANNIRVPEPTKVTDKVTTTVKINKYKTVALNKLRKNLDTPKVVAKQSITYSANTKLNRPSVLPTSVKCTLRYLRTDRNKYKFCKTNSSLRDEKETKAPDKQLLSFDRKYKNIKLKMTKKSLKKNNIPCPLYRKYGKCLRSIIGTCEFLHDKKHIAICRKFLKGLCRDEACLLSHDISANKMPTCCFYLKGKCTKNDCPYLHVKLNEKSKICHDFLKGYCEKGDTCLNRHISVNSYKHRKGPTNSSGSKITRRQSNSDKQLKETHNKVNLIPVKNNDDYQKQNSGESSKSESRYYNEVMIKSDQSETNEVIKPTRCKLGTLPSFIKF